MEQRHFYLDQATHVGNARCLTTSNVNCHICLPPTNGCTDARQRQTHHYPILSNQNADSVVLTASQVPKAKYPLSLYSHRLLGSRTRCCHPSSPVGRTCKYSLGQARNFKLNPGPSVLRRPIAIPRTQLHSAQRGWLEIGFLCRFGIGSGFIHAVVTFGLFRRMLLLPQTATQQSRTSLHTSPGRVAAYSLRHRGCCKDVE